MHTTKFSSNKHNNYKLCVLNILCWQGCQKLCILNMLPYQSYQKLSTQTAPSTGVLQTLAGTLQTLQTKVFPSMSQSSAKSTRSRRPCGKVPRDNFSSEWRFIHRAGSTVTPASCLAWVLVMHIHRVVRCDEHVLSLSMKQRPVRAAFWHSVAPKQSDSALETLTGWDKGQAFLLLLLFPFLFFWRSCPSSWPPLFSFFFFFFCFELFFL